MAHGRGQLDVAHALAADLCARDFHAAAVADLALIADLLILSAVAFPVLRGSEDALAEQAVALGFERAVVDGLGLFHFAGGPGKDHLQGRQCRSELHQTGCSSCFIPPSLSASSV